MKQDDYKKQITDHIHNADSIQLDNFLTTVSKKSNLLDMKEMTHDTAFNLSSLIGVSSKDHDETPDKLNVRAITLHNSEMDGLDIKGAEEKINLGGSKDFYSFLTNLKMARSIENELDEKGEFSNVAMIEKNGIKIPILMEDFDEDTTTFNVSQKVLSPNDFSKVEDFDFNKMTPESYKNIVSTYAEASGRDRKDVEAVFDDVAYLNDYKMIDAKKYTLDIREVNLDDRIEEGIFKGIENKDMDRVERDGVYEKTLAVRGNDNQNEQRLFAYVAVDTLIESGQENILKDVAKDLGVSKRKDRGMEFSP